MTKPPVSILMHCFNDQTLIGSAVESILSQSYGDFELLILDDGSNDGTPELVRGFRDPRIRLLTHPCPVGKQRTLNEGVDLCTHPLIARMDPRNISHPWRLEKLVGYMESHPNRVMVGSWIKWMDADGKYLRVEGVGNEQLYFHFIFNPCLHDDSALYRKQAIRSVGGYQRLEGEDLIWRLMRRHPIEVLEEPLQGTRLAPRVGSAASLPIDTASVPLHQFLTDQEVLSENALRCFTEHLWTPEGRPLLREVYETLGLLQRISARIISLENPNRSADMIRSLTEQKHRCIVRHIATRLPYSSMWRLVLHFHQPTLGLRESLHRLIPSPRKPPIR